MLERISQYLPVCITSRFEGSYTLPRGFVGFGDRISSMAGATKEFGGLLSALFSAALTLAFPKIFKEEEPSRRRKYDLAIPNELRAAFTKSPVKVVENILNLLENDFSAAKTIFINMAHDWQINPENYLQYEKNREESRRETIGVLDGLFEALVLTSEQYLLNQKFEDPDLLEDLEASVISMTDEEWEKFPNKTTELKKIRESYGTFIEEKEKTKELFDPIYACVLDELDLNLDGLSKHLNSTTELTFGHLIERLLYKRSIVSLRSDESYEVAQKLVHRILQNYDDRILDQFPIAKPLIEKLRNLLENEEKATEIKQLVRELVQIVKPSGSKSPPRRT